MVREIENHPIDVGLIKITRDVAEFNAPVGRRPEVSRDIFLRQFGKVFTQLVGNQLAGFADCAQQRHAQGAGADAGLDHPRAGETGRPRSRSVRGLWDRSLVRCAAGWESAAARRGRKTKKRLVQRRAYDAAFFMADDVLDGDLAATDCDRRGVDQARRYSRSLRSSRITGSSA